jgi:hypothetical protein
LTPENTNSTFVSDRFLFISDAHFWRLLWTPSRIANKRILGMINLKFSRGAKIDLSRADAALAAFQREKISTLIAGGDLSTTSLAEEFQDAAAFLRRAEGQGLKVYAIPGNHDMYTFEAARADLFAKHLGGFMPDRILPARINLPGGTPVVFMPMACPNILSGRGRIAGAELKESIKLVAEAPSGPVVVVGHYPLLMNTDAYTETYTHRMRNAQTIRHDLAHTGRKILYLAGHVHRFSDTPDSLHPNLRHITAPALFYRKAGGYLTVEVTNGDFNVRMQPLS